jgi:hypothetical protein
VALEKDQTAVPAVSRWEGRRTFITDTCSRTLAAVAVHMKLSLLHPKAQTRIFVARHASFFALKACATRPFSLLRPSSRATVARLQRP